MNPTLYVYSSSLFHDFRQKGIKASLFFIFLFFQFISLFAQIPASTCPADIVQGNDYDACYAIVNFPLVSSSDPNATVLYSKPSGSRFPIGTTSVMVQSFDQNGSELSVCTFNVTVVDKEAPIIANCPGNLAVANDKDACGATFTYTAPTVTDKCTFQQKTFNYTGTPVSFVVPAGVTSISVDLKGAAGGRTYYNRSIFSFPGFGGQTQTTIPVSPGQVLVIHVGGSGVDGSASGAGTGGFNGGGNGSASVDMNGVMEYAGGGGGGASDIRKAGGALADRIVVAGGGGGAGFTYEGGQGGGLTGGSGSAEPSTSTVSTTTAMGGTQTTGGAGAIFNNDFYAGNGAEGKGGDGAASVPGGGGGGGFFGGGGGSFSGGAGGSSAAFAGAETQYYQGAQEGNGSVTISYDQPATFVQTAGLPSGAIFPVGETINTFTATDAAGNVSSCSFKVTVTDTQKPVLTVPAAQNFNKTASTYSIPASAATDNCGIASLAFSITGATTRSGNGADASGAFNPGTSIINYTVTDVHGNVQTGTTSVTVAGSSSEPGSPASSVSVIIADVWAISPWGNPNTFYLGFGPASLTLKADVIKGISPYTYAWRKTGSVSLLSSTSSLAVSGAGVYTVTVTDNNRTVATVSKEIKVEDLRCGNNDDKISICHLAGNGSEKMRTICVSRNSVDKFLGNGNYLGSCREAGTSSTFAESESAFSVTQTLETQTKQFEVYPNPASGQFNVRLSSHKAGKAEVSLLSKTGSTVQRKTIVLNGEGQSVLFNTTNLAAGMYLVKLVTEEGTQIGKVFIK